MIVQLVRDRLGNWIFIYILIIMVAKNIFIILIVLIALKTKNNEEKNYSQNVFFLF